METGQPHDIVEEEHSSRGSSNYNDLEMQMSFTCSRTHVHANMAGLYCKKRIVEGGGVGLESSTRQ